MAATFDDFPNYTREEVERYQFLRAFETVEQEKVYQWWNSTKQREARKEILEDYRTGALSRVSASVPPEIMAQAISTELLMRSRFKENGMPEFSDRETYLLVHSEMHQQLDALNEI